MPAKILCLIKLQVSVRIAIIFCLVWQVLLLYTKNWKKGKRIQVKQALLGIKNNYDPFKVVRQILQKIPF